MKHTSHKGKVIWFTGLSGAGKTTLAHSLCEELKKNKIPSVLLDGDVIRQSAHNDLGFSYQDRRENIRRTAEIAKLLATQKLYVLVSLITPKEEFRQMAKNIIQKNVECQMVYVKASLETCQSRDVKGLYAKVREGKLSNLTGIGSPFEEPQNADIVIPTEIYNLEECTHLLLNTIQRVYQHIQE